MKKIFFLLFFLSGFCALLYQTVWLRLAFASFGINAQVISIVISIFMLGLALGSWLAGTYLLKISHKYRIKSLYFYAIAEAGIGISAITVPKLFSFGRAWLLTFGQTDSTSYLFLSAFILAICMLPWCFLMGTTIPLMMDYLKNHMEKDKNSFSYFYLANTFGAMIGTIITAIVLIELFGFTHTLLIASIINFAIALISLAVAFVVSHQTNYKQTFKQTKSYKVKILDKRQCYSLGLLFTTGFTSLGFEVVWNRQFTSILQTSVYAFAFIIFLYLLGTCIGLLWYRFNLSRDKVFPKSFLLLILVGVSVAQIGFNDPRASLSLVGIILTVVSISSVLGYLTPKQVDELSQGHPEVAGVAYAINVLGCILGPLFASYLLLPFLGSKLTLLLLSMPIAIFLLKNNELKSNIYFARTPVLLGVVILFITALVFGNSYEEFITVPNKIIKHDYNASVIKFGKDNRKQGLIVNGIPMTSLTPITKIMAHLPLSLMSNQPKNALIICLGMGTTFRSTASWGIDTTAVELTPSIKGLFPEFFPDAKTILQNPKTRIVIDDGRRYLQRTSTKYDLIAIDPPPPVEAAGSSLLYSKEFYEIAKQRLTDSGILAQWYPLRQGQTLQAIARSLVVVFPHVVAYQSVEGWGYHFFASKNPINSISPEQFIQSLPKNAQLDLMEWNDFNDPDILSYATRILSGKKDIHQFLNPESDILVTDDRPFNEYFLLRSTYIQKKR